jgi:hypothetical protein
MMISQPTTLLRALLVVTVAVGVTSVAGAQDKDRKPSFSVKATPQISFSPARIVVVAELKGGANDYQDYYCANVEWDWGDETRSESSADCEPYESGQSQITRRFTQERVYREGGNYKISVRLKKGDKVVVAATTSVRVRAGAGDFSGDGGQ